MNDRINLLKTDSDTRLSRIEHELSRVMHSLVFNDEPPPELRDLPFVQFKCMHAIRDHSGKKMAEIAHEMGMRKSALSQVVERLVRRGIVVRIPDPIDRRVVRLELTSEIIAVLEGMRERKRSYLARIVEQMDTDASDRVVQGLAILAETAERHLRVKPA